MTSSRRTSASTTMKASSLFLVPCLGLLSVGCGIFGGVQVRPLNSSVQKPSNVALYVAVEDEDRPIGGLEAKNFQIYEDGVLVEADHSKLTLLDRDQVALHHTVVLVDLSGKPDESARRGIAKGVSHLVEKLVPTQGVTVLGFAGDAKLRPLGEFARSKDAPAPELPAIESFQSGDESRNLNGAILLGLEQLDARLMRHKKPVRVGTLVVFTRGDDLAGRVGEDALHEALRNTPHDLYAIGIENPEAYKLEAIGKNGVKKSADLAGVPVAFEDMGITLKKAWSKYYLVQYCSPGRNGVRRVRLEVQHDGEEGKIDKGAVELEFDATGFSGGCDPNVRPAFAKSLAEPGTLGREPEPPVKGKKAKAAGESAPDAEPASSGDGAIVGPPSSGGYE